MSSDDSKENESGGIWLYRKMPVTTDNTFNIDVQFGSTPAPVEETAHGVKVTLMGKYSQVIGREFERFKPGDWVDHATYGRGRVKSPREAHHHDVLVEFFHSMEDPTPWLTEFCYSTHLVRVPELQLIAEEAPEWQP